MEVGRRALVVPFGPNIFDRRPSARLCVDRFKLRAALNLQLALAFDGLQPRAHSFIAPLHCEVCSLNCRQPLLMTAGIFDVRILATTRVARQLPPVGVSLPPAFRLLQLSLVSRRQCHTLSTAAIRVRLDRQLQRRGKLLNERFGCRRRRCAAFCLPLTHNTCMRDGRPAAPKSQNFAGRSLK